MMRDPLITRILLNVLMFVSVIFFPWWVTLALGFIMLALFNVPEVLLWAAFFDSLYAAPVPAFWNIQFLFTLIVLVLFLASIFLKRRMIFY